MDEETLAIMNEIREEAGSETTEESLQATDAEEDDGWEDLEPDIEAVTVRSLLDEKTFPDVHSMLQHCSDMYAFDFLKIRKEFDLDFLGTVKLVNYIRSEVKHGRITQAVASKQLFEADQYLQPVLEDDALLFSLGDLDEDTALREESSDTETKHDNAHSAMDSAETARIIEGLKDRYDRVNAKLQRFTDLVKRPFMMNSNTENAGRESRRWSTSSLPFVSDVETSSGGTFKRRNVIPESNSRESRNKSAGVVKDQHYWDSYAQTEIHETMLKDAIRTEAYRDFIYNNQHLFRNKIILDVGCGSGILSLFCANVGALSVFAVDKSDIIHQARAVIYDNKLDHIIKCFHSRVEDLKDSDIFPKVDVIISEWMGYSLLYEAMLDSVLYARDHFLRPGGLVFPSEANITIAPVYDPVYADNRVSFWNNVYGFNMRALSACIYDDVKVRTIPANAIVGSQDDFLHLNLQTCTTTDLKFSKPFEVVLRQDIPSLHGFAIWFDVQFTPRITTNTRSATDASETSISEPPSEVFSSMVLRTSPDQPVTHWEQAYLLIDSAKRNVKATALKNGAVIHGVVAFAPRLDNDREIDIGVRWETSTVEGGTQTWAMR